MKVLYDHQTFTNQNYGGISRYFCELFNEFNNIKDIDTLYSIRFSNNHYLTTSTSVPHYNFIPYFEFRGKKLLINLLNKQYSIKKLQDDDFDVFHPTYYDPYFLKYIGDKPYVLTVYDMIHEKYPKIFSERDNTAANKKNLIKNASKIIAISENTKKDIIDIYGVSEHKIKVVYLASSLRLSNPLNAYDLCNIYGINKPYILYVGSRSKYKNFKILFNSYVNNFSGEFDLICFGGGKFNSNELESINSNITCNIIQLHGSDDLLASLYKHAFCFVYPSIYEGFGIPPLEAMSVGCPVIASNVSSIPEVVGDAAILFNPHSEDELAAGIKSLYNNPTKNNLIIRGFEQENKFSWDKTANETLDVYKSII
ncbi:glycosyltransferase family 1 protein [Methanohalophilus sp. RSK]|uniref:glycosyltransferase family 4 protein n=1 Tax=Methanohalophilus sp. RSK TaxID=2485783 RepID=UPI000F43CBE0|nr:glycosyltransferase family 1 protein [Methanohalophilus sp. RSK]RNI15808.1 glycosyltransferase family 1 protein [Methanohalophilus sp. RSK]